MRCCLSFFCVARFTFLFLPLFIPYSQCFCSYMPLCNISSPKVKILLLTGEKNGQTYAYTPAHQALRSFCLLFHLALVFTGSLAYFVSCKTQLPAAESRYLLPSLSAFDTGIGKDTPPQSNFTILKV
ncbi:hypothetical protein BKA57DRAFT_95300 [Linnemannia elongata]|nr:hypothetical protein BKA57DRAFT_95300 [Linnemannia elongata]